MHEDEKIDRFLQGLKYNIRVEVLKSQADTFDACARIALNVDSALWRASGRNAFGDRQNAFTSSQNQATPMEIGNVQHRNLSNSQQGQRKKDMEKGACFRCHKVGCRPYICRPKVNNVTFEDSTNIDNLSDSESDTHSGKE